MNHQKPDQLNWKSTTFHTPYCPHIATGFLMDLVFSNVSSSLCDFLATTVLL